MNKQACHQQTSHCCQGFIKSALTNEYINVLIVHTSNLVASNLRKFGIKKARFLHHSKSFSNYTHCFLGMRRVQVYQPARRPHVLLGARAARNSSTRLLRNPLVQITSALLKHRVCSLSVQMGSWRDRDGHSGDFGSGVCFINKLMV